jgi:hypothetical protein
MDLWGNVNLPLYREIENFTSNAWKPVSDREGNIATYGSLIGVPTVGMLSDGISNFSIKARQFDVTCSRNEWRSGIHNDSLWANMTSTWGLAFDMSCTNRTMGNAYPLPILSLSQVNVDSTGSNISVGSCSVTLNYLRNQSDLQRHLMRSIFDAQARPTQRRIHSQLRRLHTRRRIRQHDEFPPHRRQLRRGSSQCPRLHQRGEMDSRSNRLHRLNLCWLPYLIWRCGSFSLFSSSVRRAQTFRKKEL